MYAGRPGRIGLDHIPGDQRIADEDDVTVRADEPVSRAVHGDDRSGTESRVDEPPSCWEVTGRGGFAADSAYHPS